MKTWALAFSILAAACVLSEAAGGLPSHNQMSNEGKNGRKLKYSGSWGGSWGSVSVNGDSGSWNTPYSSGSWGGGGSGSTPTNNNANTNTNTNTATTNTVDPPTPSPGAVYYNGNGVLVQKLADGQTQTVVNNEYANVNVVSGRRH